MEYQDYYKTLGVERGASAAELKKAFRDLSKKFHPDLNSAANAADKFKTINEAYEVLRDPEKRKAYDSFGANWKAGQDFNPPNSWQNVDFNFGGARPRGRAGGSPMGGGFSDFFETFFSAQQSGARQRPEGFGSAFDFSQQAGRDGATKEVELTISLEDTYHGATKEIEMTRTDIGHDGGRKKQSKKYSVKIPAGTTSGKKIRLAGQGAKGSGTGKAGDLLLHVKLRPHPVFEVHGHNLSAKLYVSPWEAALGTKISFETLDGKVTLTIPEGSQSGSKLRLKDKGLPKKNAQRGNLELEILIRVPKEMTDAERALFEELKTVSDFDPRG